MVGRIKLIHNFIFDENNFCKTGLYQYT